MFPAGETVSVTLPGLQKVVGPEAAIEYEAVVTVTVKLQVLTFPFTSVAV